jgi:hypothetical protein
MRIMVSLLPAACLRRGVRKRNKQTGYIRIPF